MNSKITPGEFLGYATSTIFLFAFLWLMWNAQTHLTKDWLFWLGVATLAPLVPAPSIFVYFKMWAMFRIDTSGTTKRRTPAKRS